MAANLWIQEVNIQREIKRHWQRHLGIHPPALLRTSGLGDVEAEEMAIFPGMEELSALMYVNQYRKTSEFDRGGARLRTALPKVSAFISLPTTLDWYMKHVFTFERRTAQSHPSHREPCGARRVAERCLLRQHLAIFSERSRASIRCLKIRSMTSVRLVTNAEKMVLRETQRAFVYFSLHGLTVDRIIVNRLFPLELHDEFFDKWHELQGRVLTEIEAYFAPIPVLACAPLPQRSSRAGTAGRAGRRFMATARIPPR